MEVRKIDYFDGDVLLEATVASEGTEKRPIVFVFHAWAGKDAFAEQKAVELAKLGFVGCAVDLYGKGIVGKTPEENAALMNPFMANRSLLKKRILACLSLIPSIKEADGDQIAAIGYCFGGLSALDFARSGANVKAVVSFHGLLQAEIEKDPKLMRSKVLALHGADDPMVSQEDLVHFNKEMKERKADFQLHVFGGAMHAFTNPEANNPLGGTLYHELSAVRSWSLMKLFFGEVFGEI